MLHKFTLAEQQLNNFFSEDMTGRETEVKVDTKKH